MIELQKLVKECISAFVENKIELTDGEKRLPFLNII